MGEAKRRGTFEQRKANAAKKSVVVQEIPRTEFVQKSRQSSKTLKLLSLLASLGIAGAFGAK
jgi:hypothetical protein